MREYHKRYEPVHDELAIKHPLYMTWNDMLARCYDQNAAYYENYGGRGIKVCERWWHFKNFANDMGLKPDNKFQIDRIDNDGNYEPGNCRWADRSTQMLNRRKFKNNTTGYRGVVKKREGSGFEARINWQNQRLILGYRDNAKDAAALHKCAMEAIKAGWFTPELFGSKYKARSNSKTGIRGINPHPEGGFVVRLNVGKVRHYIGYFLTLQEAIDAKNRFVEKQAQGT